MSCDNLVCAHCSGLVEQGRCASCRAARDHFHSNRPALPAAQVLAVAALLALLLLLLSL